jgi:hypothetical protein
MLGPVGNKSTVATAVEEQGFAAGGGAATMNITVLAFACFSAAMVPPSTSVQQCAAEPSTLIRAALAGANFTAAIRAVGLNASVAALLPSTSPAPATAAVPPVSSLKRPLWHLDR